MRERETVTAALRVLPLGKGDALLCAVSGGADSMALLHAALAVWPPRGVRVAAAHFRHGIRPEDEEDAQLVRGYCAERGVPLYEGGADVPRLAAQDRVGLETAARDARYAFLDGAIRASGASLCATAHHADDQAETVLMHLMRGAGTLGAAGIPGRRGPYVRPFLQLRRAELQAYCGRNAVPWAHDSTNDEPDNPRNALRLQVLPLMEAIRPGAAAALARGALAAREDEEALSALAGRALAERETPLGLYLNGFTSLPAAVRKRALRTYLCGLGGSPEAAHLNALDDMIADGRAGRALDLPGLRVRLCRARWLYLRKAEKED